MKHIADIEYKGKELSLYETKQGTLVIDCKIDGVLVQGLETGIILN